MQHWAEIRTAFFVADLKTISAAAEALDLHRATVVRHIEVLEDALGAKIFQRHNRGYEPTETGLDLLNVARGTQDQFNQMAARARNTSDALSGDFFVTSHEHVASLLIPALNRFQKEHPDVQVRYLASAEVLKLEYGAAHVALSSGPKPTEPDNVVRHFTDSEFGLYAQQSYLDAHGAPDFSGPLEGHRFVRWDTQANGMPFARWLEDHTPHGSVVFSSRNLSVVQAAIFDGMGIGFVAETDAAQRKDLVRLCPSADDWKTALWLVAHVDLHRSTKIHTFLKIFIL